MICQQIIELVPAVCCTQHGLLPCPVTPVTESCRNRAEDGVYWGQAIPKYILPGDLMRFRKLRSAALLLLTAAVLCSGCSPSGEAVAEASAASAAENFSGSLDPGSEGVLDAGQQALLMNFAQYYFRTMSTLELRDPSLMFAEPDGLYALVTRETWRGLCAIHATSEADLRLMKCAYTVTLEIIEEDDELLNVEGGVLVQMWLDSSIRFNAWPDTDTADYNSSHRFTLIETRGEWRIASYFHDAGLYYHLLRKAKSDGTDAVPPYVDYLAGLSAENRTMHKEGTLAEPSFDHAYDRVGAVGYAREWVGKRKEGFGDYSFVGGNCQNFASQCLYASGIPMDLTGSDVWKYYGEDSDDSRAAYGRSQSWSGIEQFLNYLKNNTGKGIRAVVDAPFYSGQPGDLIYLGMYGEWRHVVVITSLVRDSAGNTVDYLISSNTEDLTDYPVSAYWYTRQMLVHIAGWNE